ncbi:hypothetical protein C8R47DRAFT_1158501 [Mycena vitilis]|nr:hypothetical protein C8R47DRAFT_1158501 [Mycena vitilis]
MAEPETSNAADFPLDPMPIPEFCKWMDSDRAPASIADAVVTDLSWWRPSTSWHHCVLLRTLHEPTNGQSRSYQLRLTQEGSYRKIATFYPDGFDAQSLDTKSRVLCALGSEDYTRSLAPVGSAVYRAVLPAFQDFLDQKWRGPPPTLRDVVRYLRRITAFEEQTGTSDNYFWFWRNLVYILALRHYSFPFVLLTVFAHNLVHTSLTRGARLLGSVVGPPAIDERPWRPHARSTIQELFNYLRTQEEDVSFTINPFELVFHPLRYSARMNTSTIVEEIDKDDNPQQRRGDFISAEKVDISMGIERHTRVLSWTSSPCWPAMTIPCWTVKPTPIERHVRPEPWEREEQIYAPAKEEYIVALEKMCSTLPAMAEPETSHAVNLPLAPMSIPEFCDWINSDKAPASLADTVVTDISWWHERPSILHHQFVVLRIQHTGTGNQSRAYHLRLERAGKRGSRNPLALDTAMFLPGTFDDPFFAKHALFCALGSQDYMRSLAHAKHLQFIDIERQQCLAGYQVEFKDFLLPAFQDFLDHKWRGPPPTLRDAARYMRLLTSIQPNYSLTHANCFWFSRNLVTLLALRHYSFPYVLLTVPIEKHMRQSATAGVKFLVFLNNLLIVVLHFPPFMCLAMFIPDIAVFEPPPQPPAPSTLEYLFLYLRSQEQKNGSLLLNRAIRGLVGLVSAVVPWCAFAGTFILAFAQKLPAKILAPAIVLFWVGGIGAVPPILEGWFIPFLESVLHRYAARRSTSAIVKHLDAEDTAEERRGEFIPPDIVVVWQTERHARVLAWTSSPWWPAMTIPYWTVKRPQVRCALPEPWERDEQIYAPAKEEYLAALEQMRQSPHIVGQTRVSEELVRHSRRVQYMSNLR